MKLGHRVIGAFAIIALVFAFLGEVLISRMQAQQDQATTARVTDTLRSTLNVAFRSERQFYFEVEESQINPAQPLEWAIPQENEGLGTILLTARFDSFVTLDADLRGILERIKLARAKLWESLQEWKASAKAAPSPAAAGNENMTVLGTVAPKPIIRRNMVEIRQLVQQIHDLLNRKEDILRSQEGTGVPLTLLRLALYVLVLLAVYLGFRLTRTVTNALTQASAAIEEVVLGEHKIQLDLKATDEIGDLHRTIQKVSETFGKVVEELRAVTEGMVDCRFNQEIHGAYSGQFAHIKEALNSVIKNVGSMIQCIKDITAVLTNSANDMKSIVGDLQKSAESIKIQAVATEEISQSFGNMASTATSAEEISVNISNILSTAEQMSRNMNLIASSIEEVSRSITHVSGDAKQAANVAGDAMKLAENATGTMNSLGTAAREIGKVTEVIKRIAEQTNLLALNATIEAASAGEAGKGFAVVAHEIKELANQSAQAAEGIADKISGVQTNTQDAVKVISEVAVIIRTIYGSVEGIAQVMEKETASATSISLNTQEAAKGISNITRAIAEISKGATDMSQVIGESAQGVTSLSTHVKAVSDALGHNTADVEKIHSSAEMVSGLSGELQILMEKFQV